MSITEALRGVTRQQLDLPDYDFKIKDKELCDNAQVDALCRLLTGNCTGLTESDDITNFVMETKSSEKSDGYYPYP